MSLQHLGISHFPVLHRGFPSPTSRVSLESSPNQDLTQDNKDVLLERLNDLVLRLSKDSSLDDSTVSAIHTGVDQIESLIRDRESNHRSPQVDNDSKAPKANGEDGFWRPLSPPGNVRMHLPDLSNSPRVSAPPRSPPPQITSARAIELAASAAELASKLSTTVAELQIRKEESDHIHDLLVTRAEKAAERILVLEYRTKEMEEDFDANQSELKFLRIQLQAIEAQCSQYIPQKEDVELSESIMNWKIDWEDIDRRSKARRKKCHAPKAILDDTIAIMNGS